MYNCHDCKENYKKYEEVSSRHNSMMYHEQDYDRMHGKGSFKKKYPDSHKAMEELMDMKTKMLTAHMKHELPEEEPHDESKPHTDKSVADVPVI